MNVCESLVLCFVLLGISWHCWCIETRNPNTNVCTVCHLINHRVAGSCGAAWNIASDSSLKDAVRRVRHTHDGPIPHPQHDAFRGHRQELPDSIIHPATHIHLAPKTGSQTVTGLVQTHWDWSETHVIGAIGAVGVTMRLR